MSNSISGPPLYAAMGSALGAVGEVLGGQADPRARAAGRLIGHIGLLVGAQGSSMVGALEGESAPLRPDVFQ